ncbi:MAG: CpaF family protein, partial [Proteobacteria bacterium]|nr:CpaF family protein [Pseudomonadota bacterium]
GLGPLEDLLKNPDVSEIMVNRADQIFVELKGRPTLIPARFSGDKQLMGVIERIVAPIGRRIDEKTPMVDARLRDGSRVHAIIPPLALDGPVLTIRKFSKDIMGPETLIKYGALTEEMSDFLRACVQAKLNIIISGGTGTGKTTLLNTMASFIPNNDRIITVEDSAELRLAQELIVRLESRPANLQGEGAIPIRELVRNTLRMRPDRIVVGECRGAEALDMLQAMNTGHDGSMTTIHSNSPRDSIARLETLVMFAGMDLPSKAIREQIASAVQLIVQLTRLGDGSRKITAITEVTGMESTTVSLQDIFQFKEKGVDEHGKVLGSFLATGLVPTFAQTFKKKGIKLPKGLIGG